MKDSVVSAKSKAFAVRIVRLCRYLQDEKKESKITRARNKISIFRLRFVMLGIPTSENQTFSQNILCKRKLFLDIR